MTHIGTRYPNAIAQAAAIDVLGIIGIENGNCIFLSSGSEAVEFAIQAARRITKRTSLLTFKNSYLAAYGLAGRKGTDEWVLFDWQAGISKNVSGTLKKFRLIPSVLLFLNLAEADRGL